LVDPGISTNPVFIHAVGSAVTAVHESHRHVKRRGPVHLDHVPTRGAVSCLLIYCLGVQCYGKFVAGRMAVCTTQWTRMRGGAVFYSLSC